MLNIANIFTSIDGEVNVLGQGTFTVFIRFSGCNEKCFYCDTAWSQSADSGKPMSEKDIVNKVNDIGCNKVTITGGEPLLQNIVPLIEMLYNQGIDISVETNGTIEIPIKALGKASWVVDKKIGRNFIYENLPKLSGVDFIKIAVWDRKSYDEAKQFYDDNLHLTLARFAFSAVLPGLSHAQLCEWMIQDKLFDVILNCQIHKFIWSKENMNDSDRIEH